VLSVTSNGGDASVPVTLTCTAIPTAILSGVTPDTINRPVDAGQAVQVDLSFSNTGTANLNFTITSNRNWITTQTPQGQVLPDAEQVVRISAACGPNQETRTGTLSIDSNGGDADVPVTLSCTVPAAPVLGNVVPALALDQTSPKPASSEFVLPNVGNAELTYQIDSDSNWLSVDSVSGTIATNASAQVLVAGQCTDFIGDRAGKLSISSNGGDHVIDVSLICFGPELGDVQPKFMELSAPGRRPVQRNLSFANVGNVDMSYSVSSDSDWLCPDISAAGVCQSAQGSLSPSSSADITVRANCPTLTNATVYSGSLTISGSGGREVVPVTLTCGQVPQ